uniref:Uncharacterized protein n=1 Tax=Thermosporothrix sp. COM3 TaxID=2490863 RepID=A0A455SEX4_9CHLR|nr:hypothetical protein KTC_17680 [Thermosporothrix sp. COM3]
MFPLITHSINIKGEKEILVSGYVDRYLHTVHYIVNNPHVSGMEEYFILLVYRKDGSRETYLISPGQIFDETKRYTYLYEKVSPGVSSDTDREIRFWYGITRDGAIEDTF